MSEDERTQWSRELKELAMVWPAATVVVLAVVALFLFGLGWTLFGPVDARDAECRAKWRTAVGPRVTEYDVTYDDYKSLCGL